MGVVIGVVDDETVYLGVGIVLPFQFLLFFIVFQGCIGLNNNDLLVA